MIHKFHFNESVVGLLSATDFFYNTIDFSTGEIRKNKKDFFLCLAIVERVATNKNKKKLLSDSALREFKREYKPLLQALFDLGILIKIANFTRTSATQVELNPLYVGECEMNLTQTQLNLVNKFFIKEVTRGKNATTTLPISIDISYDNFVLLMENAGKSKDKIDIQWGTIQKINSTGVINPRKKVRGRLYSDFTSLSSLIHPYVRIDGKSCVEIDQHATYWTLLPQLFKETLLLAHPDIQYDLMLDIQKLTKFLVSSKNIYKQIGLDTNQPTETIKYDSISFICDPNKHMGNKNKKIIKEWFQTNFPFCSYHLDNIRKNNLVSYRIQAIEAKVFVKASKELNKNGIACFTKHDSIIVTNDNAKTAEAELKKQMTKYNIPVKVRDKIIKNHAPLSHESIETPKVVSIDGIVGNNKDDVETAVLNIGQGTSYLRHFPVDHPTSPILSDFHGDIDGDIPQFESLKVIPKVIPRYSANVWIKNGKEYWRCKKDGSKTPITKLKSSMTESEFLEYVRNK